MDKAGCHEILMSVVTPSELWKESGRWDAMGSQMAKFQDKSSRELCLSPTNEEAVTDIFRSTVKSYKNLPVTLKWKSKEFLTTTKNVIRSIIHGKNINNYMVANIKCDMYNVHLKFNRDKRRPIGINTLSFLRRSLDSYIDCICASKVIFFDFELLKNFDFFKFYPLYSHFSYSFKKV